MAYNETESLSRLVHRIQAAASAVGRCAVGTTTTDLSHLPAHNSQYLARMGNSPLSRTNMHETNRAMAAEYRYEAARLRIMAEMADGDGERRQMAEAAALCDYLASMAEAAGETSP